MINKQGRESVSIGRMLSAAMARIMSIFGDRTRDRTRVRTRPDATGRDQREIYLAAEAARSRARRAAKKEIKTMGGSLDPSDRTRPDARPDGDRTRPDATSLYIESKNLKYKNKAHPFPEDWRPDEEGYQLGVKAFGVDGVEAAISIHRNTWLSRPLQLTEKQWSAKWSAWCELNIAPGLPLVRLLASRRRRAPEAPPNGTPVQLPPEPDDPLWTPVRERLVADLSEAVIKSWFHGAAIELADGAATITLPSKFLRQYVETQFDRKVLLAVQAVHPGVTSVRFTVAQRSASG